LGSTIGERKIIRGKGGRLRRITKPLKDATKRPLGTRGTLRILGEGKKGERPLREGSTLRTLYHAKERKKFSSDLRGKVGGGEDTGEKTKRGEEDILLI